MFCTTGLASAIGIGASGCGSLALTAVDGAPTKAQAGAGGAVTAVFPFFDTVGPGVSIIYMNLWPSDAGGWIVLRGYMEFGLSAFVLYQAKIVSLPDIGDFRVGGRAGMSASMALYVPSTLAFFMPSVDLAPFISWTPTGLPAFSFSIALPSRWLLRRDVLFSGSVGLEIGASYSLDSLWAGKNAPEEESK